MSLTDSPLISIDLAIGSPSPFGFWFQPSYVQPRWRSRDASETCKHLEARGVHGVHQIQIWCQITLWSSQLLKGEAFVTEKKISVIRIYICIHICIYKRIQNKHSQMISYGHACSLFCKGDQTWREVGAHWQNPNHPKNTSPSYTSPLPEYPLPLWKCRCRTLGSSGCQKSIVMKIDVSRSFPFTSFTSIIIHPKSSRPKKHLSISPSISQLNGTFSRLRTQWENFSAISGNFPIIPLGFQKKTAPTFDDLLGHHHWINVLGI